MKALLFDLDDTLYQEREFVRSGFRAVASYVESRHRQSADDVERRLTAILERDGRGEVFDTLLKELGLYAKERVALLVFLYRSHEPRIHLFEDVPAVLDKLRGVGMRLGLVTDGMASVQRRKVEALGVQRWLDVAVYTEELGPRLDKPSPVPFEVALEILDVSPSQATYVGNDPNKDFAGARSLGVRTIRVRRESYMTGPLVESSEDADIVVDRFGDLPSVLKV